MRISTIDFKDEIVLLELAKDENFTQEDFEKFSQLFKKYGARNLLALADGIKLTILDDEKLKKLGLQRIKE